MRDVIAALNKALERNEPVALATVVDVQGASPAQVGFKLLVRPNGDVVGNVGGGELERRVREEAVTYAGMIGSRRKVGTIFEHLRADGISNEQLARVRAPIGLDLGGRSPEEIALAILAEVVQVRYGGSCRARALLEQGD